MITANVNIDIDIDVNVLAKSSEDGLDAVTVPLCSTSASEAGVSRGKVSPLGSPLGSPAANRTFEDVASRSARFPRSAAVAAAPPSSSAPSAAAVLAVHALRMAATSF